MKLKKCLLFMMAFMALYGAAGCLPAAAPLPPLPTDTPPSPTETPTPTVVWFPATATFTPFPTPGITPTADMRPEFGALIFTDDFSQAEYWTLGKFPSGTAAFGKNELTIAINEKRGYISSLRSQPELSNFYAEITASPSLCMGSDEYGILLRASGQAAFYRFSLSCDGQARLDRFFNGVASSPQPWVMSAAIPPGAPSSTRLAVIASGKEMRFFANNEYLFTVSDPTLTSGGLGVFARAAGDTPVTVNFTDLAVYELD